MLLELILLAMPLLLLALLAAANAMALARADVLALLVVVVEEAAVCKNRRKLVEGLVLLVLILTPEGREVAAILWILCDDDKCAGIDSDGNGGL